MTRTSCFLVRPATDSDLRRLSELEQEIFRPPENRPWSEKQLAVELDEDRFLLAESAHRIAGYAIFRAFADEAELLRLGTSRELRRRGIASLLLHRGLESLAGQGVLTCHLEVRSDNRPAIAFYLRHGFETCGLRPAYYADGCSASLLSRRLKSA